MLFFLSWIIRKRRSQMCWSLKMSPSVPELIILAESSFTFQNFMSQFFCLSAIPHLHTCDDKRSKVDEFKLVIPRL